MNQQYDLILIIIDRLLKYVYILLYKEANMVLDH